MTGRGYFVVGGLVRAIHVYKTLPQRLGCPGQTPVITEKIVSMTPPLASRIALVTGASRGIGYAAARALARAGAHVVAVARTQGGLEELDDEIRKAGGSATLVPLNLTDFDGIARLGAALHERHGRLDILVGNAGVAGPSSPLGHIEVKPWDEVMAVNVTANFQLIRCMEPLLKKSDAGRAVFVTSGAASKAPAYLGPYAASKAALETLVRVWAQETASTPVRVNLFNPGPIRTRMRATVFPGEDPSTLDTPDQAAEFILPMCAPDWSETGKLYDYPTRTLMSFRPPV
ncbi:MAG: SDR family NAD(P)-dependent oxidoreductase [Bradyrhizobium sp.]